MSEYALYVSKLEIINMLFIPLNIIYRYLRLMPSLAFMRLNRVDIGLLHNIENHVHTFAAEKGFNSGSLT